METIRVRFFARGERRYTDPWTYRNRCEDKQSEDFVHELNMKLMVETLAYHLPATTELKSIDCWGRKSDRICSAITNQVGLQCLEGGEFDLDKISEVANRRVAFQMTLFKPHESGKRHRDSSLITKSMSAWNWVDYERYEKLVSTAKGANRELSMGMRGVDTPKVRWTTSEGEISCTCHEKWVTLKIGHSLVDAWNKLRTPSDWKEHGYLSYWTARYKLQSRVMWNRLEWILRDCIDYRDQREKQERDPAWLRKRHATWHARTRRTLSYELSRATAALPEMKSIEALTENLRYWPNLHPDVSKVQESVRHHQGLLEEKDLEKGLSPWWRAKIEELVKSNQKWLAKQSLEYKHGQKELLEIYQLRAAQKTYALDQKCISDLMDLEWEAHQRSVELEARIRDGRLQERKIRKTKKITCERRRKNVCTRKR